jgi:hypothetical protein
MSRPEQRRSRRFCGRRSYVCRRRWAAYAAIVASEMPDDVAVVGYDNWEVFATDCRLPTAVDDR